MLAWGEAMIGLVVGQVALRGKYFVFLVHSSFYPRFEGSPVIVSILIFFQYQEKIYMHVKLYIKNGITWFELVSENDFENQLLDEFASKQYQANLPGPMSNTTQGLSFRPIPK